MALWIQRTTIQAPRNGTDSHTVEFSPATAGNLLVLVLGAPVTHTVPAGWTRQAQALNDVELSVFTKVATASESSFTTTHNSADYPMGGVLYEFAAGSIWVTGSNKNSAGVTDPGPVLEGLTGTNLTFAALCNPWTDTGPDAAEFLWTAPVVTDLAIGEHAAATDGYLLSIGFVEDNAATSFSCVPTVVGYTWNDFERLAFAVKVAAGDDPDPVEPTATRFFRNVGAWVPTVTTRDWGTP